MVRLGSCGKSWISAINPLTHESNFIEQNKLRDRACLMVILYIYIYIYIYNLHYNFGQIRLKRKYRPRHCRLKNNENVKTTHRGCTVHYIVYFNNISLF